MEHEARQTCVRDRTLDDDIESRENTAVARPEVRTHRRTAGSPAAAVLIGSAILGTSSAGLATACGPNRFDQAPGGTPMPAHPDARGNDMSVRPLGTGDPATAPPTAPRETVTSLIPSFTMAKATYVVGKGQQYSSLKDVASVLKPGDVVDLLGDASYPGDVRFSVPGTADKKIVIRGVLTNGHRPVLSGGGDVLEAGADHYVFEGLELTGGQNRCFYVHADDITLRDSLVRDCPGHGIIGADQDSGSFTMEYVEVRKCGANGATGSGRQHHSIYMATDEKAHPKSRFRMQFSWVHDTTGGNAIKSRAERNEIYYNWIEGAVYHALEMVGPDGQDAKLAREDADVVGNVFVQTNDFFVVRVGGDGTGETGGRYRFAYNTFLVNSARPVFRLFGAVEAIDMTNNAFFRLAGVGLNLIDDSEVKWVSKRAVGGSSNYVPSGSAAPAEWRTTATADDAGWESLASSDFHLVQSSPLLGKATSAPMAMTAFPIDDVLNPPLFEPRRGIALPDARKPSGKLSIGAFEGATTPAAKQPAP